MKKSPTHAGSRRDDFKKSNNINTSLRQEERNTMGDGQIFPGISDESAFWAIFESTGTASLIIAEDTSIIMANKECGKITGYAPEELIGKQWTNYVAKEYLEQMLKYHRLRRVEGGKAPTRYEVKLIHKNGTIRDTIIVVGIIPGSKNSIVSMLDITDLKKAQADLEKSEKLHREIIENLTDLVIKTDLEGRLLFASPSFCKMVGKKEKSLLGKKFKLWIHPDDRENSVKARAGLFKPPYTCTVVQRVKTKSGWHWLEWSNRGILDAKGEVIELLGVARDITDRQKVEEQLIRSEDKFRSLFESTPDGIIVLDKQGAIVNSNPAIAKITGYSEAEIIGQSITRFIPESYLKIIENRQRKRAKGDYSVFKYEMEFIKKSGSTIPVEINTVPIVKDKDVEGMLIIARDISESKQALASLEFERYLLSTLMDSMPDSIFFKDRESRFLRVNRAKAQRLGLKDSADVYGRSDFDFFPSEFAEETFREENQIMSTGIPVINKIEKLETELGKYRWNLVTKVPIKDADGNITGIVGISRDISKLKETQDKLSESEEKYRRIIEHSTNLFYSRTPQHMLTYVSPQSRHYLGCEPEEAMVRWTDFITDNKFNQTGIEAIQRAIDTGKPQPPYQLELRTKDNRIIWVEVSEAPVVENGKTVAIVGSLTDITERKRAEQALMESRARLARAEAISHLGSWEMDIASGKSIWSDEYFRICGFEPGAFEPIAEKSLEIIHPDDRDLAARKLKNTIATGEQYNVEYRIIRPDGSIRWVHSVADLVYDDKGKPQKVVGSFLDITNRRIVTEKLRFSEERYRTIVENSVTGILIVDDHFTVTFANRKLCEILGYEESEIVGNKFIKFLEPDSIAYVKKLYLRRQKGEVVPADYTINIVRKSGEIRRVEINSAVVHDTRGKIRTIAQVLDITERVKAEKERRLLEVQLRQAQKMEAIGRLAGGIAHDFNNILTVILGYSDLAIMSLNPDDPLYSPLQKIKDAAQRSAALIRKLMAFSRQQNAEPQVLDLNTHLESTKNLLEKLVGEDISMKYLPGENVRPVYVDPTQIDQVVTNLVVNARDAMPNGGLLMVETNNFVFDAEYCQKRHGYKPGNYVMIAITDTGHGMDKKTLDQVFEPFFTTKGKGQGTGLGLSTVYGIVKQNNGYVHIYSEPGQGTTVKVYFPEYLGEKKESEKIDLSTDNLKGRETILLVEDEDDVRDLAKHALEQLGYKVYDFNQPVSALEFCEKFKGDIDLMITDIIMPEMNGKELHDRIEKIKPGLKVLYMSGYTANVIAIRGIIKRGTQFLQKPFSPISLGKRVREVLDKSGKSRKSRKKDN